MLAFVFIVATTNFVLGMAVAIIATHDSGSLGPMFSGLLKRKSDSDGPVHDTSSHEGGGALDKPHLALQPDDTTSHIGHRANTTPIDTLPGGWSQQLAELGIETTDPFEAACHIIRVAEQSFQNRLAENERQLRQTLQKNAPQAVRTSLQEMLAQLGGWIRWANEIAEQIASAAAPHETSGTFSEIDAAIMAEVEGAKSLCEFIQTVAKSSNPVSQGHEVIQKLLEVFAKSYKLRNLAIGALAQLYESPSGKRVDLPAGWRGDMVTLLPNRLAVPHLLRKIRGDDSAQAQPIAAACVELQAIEEINERFGIQRADRVIAEFAQLVTSLMRLDRGDQVVRIAGPRLFVLIADCDVEGARLVMERVRQTLEASSMMVGDEELPLQVNCGICSIDVNDTAASLTIKLSACTAMAKSLGTSTTIRHAEPQPVLVERTTIDIKPHKIEIAGI